MNAQFASCEDLVSQSFANRISPELRLWVRQVCQLGVFRWQDIAVALAKILNGNHHLASLMSSSNSVEHWRAKRELKFTVGKLEDWQRMLVMLLRLRAGASVELIAHVLLDFLSGRVHSEATLEQSVAEYDLKFGYGL